MIQFIVDHDSDYNILRDQLDGLGRKPRDAVSDPKLRWCFMHIWDFAKQDNVLQIRQLIKSGAYQINQATPIKRNTPLHVACWSKSLEAIKELTDLNANTHLKNIKG